MIRSHALRHVQQRLDDEEVAATTRSISSSVGISMKVASHSDTISRMLLLFSGLSISVSGLSRWCSPIPQSPSRFPQNVTTRLRQDPLMLPKVRVSSLMLPLSLIPFRYSDMLRILLSAVCLFPSMSTRTILPSASIVVFFRRWIQSLQIVGCPNDGFR